MQGMLFIELSCLGLVTQDLISCHAQPDRVFQRSLSSQGRDSINIIGLRQTRIVRIPKNFKFKMLASSTLGDLPMRRPIDSDGANGNQWRFPMRSDH